MSSNGIRSPEQVDVLAQLVDMRREIAALRAATSESQLRQLIATQYDAECGRLEQLRDDAVRILNALVEARTPPPLSWRSPRSWWVRINWRPGYVTRDQLNVAIGRPIGRHG